MRFRSRNEVRPAPERRPPPLPLPEPRVEDEPAPSAQPTRWEYKIKRLASERSRGLVGWRQLEETLNAEGAQGWELVALDAESATFKRVRAPE